MKGLRNGVMVEDSLRVVSEISGWASGCTRRATAIYVLLFLQTPYSVLGTDNIVSLPSGRKPTAKRVDVAPH